MTGDPTSASRFAAIEPTEIAAGDLQLRVWDPSMVGAVLAAAADPEVTRWNTVRVPGAEPGTPLVGEQQAHQWIEHRRRWEGHATWAVCDATSGDVLGYVSMHDLHPRHLSAEVGYWVLPSSRGRGVARRAVAAAAGFAFGALGINRVELFHAIDNPASCAVATGAGFAVEGLARQAYRYGDGVLHDDHMHGRLAADPYPA